MSQYTIQIRTLVEDYQLNIFDFVYPFYTDSPKWKQEFENLFINHYYHHEIGFETVERFQQRLQSRLNMIMPYYSQLYLTQWNVVGKDMMTSKDLEEKTIRELLTDGTISENIDSSSTESNDGESSNQGNTTESNESESSNQGNTTESNTSESTTKGNTTESNTSESTAKVDTTDENSQTSHSESQSTSTGQGTQNESRIEDGVAIVNLENGNKTATSQNETQATSTGESDDTSSYEGTSTSTSTSSSSQEGTSTSTSTSTGSQEGTSTSTSTSTASQEGTSTSSSTSTVHNESTGSQLTSKEGTSQSKTTETLTFISKGDIGIQTPAYAITEWRKVLININQMIINECEDLFMLIY